MVMHLYQVVGRHLPVEKKDGSVDNNTKIYRMKVFAEDEVRARALFFSQPPLGGAHPQPPPGAASAAARPRSPIAGRGFRHDTGNPWVGHCWGRAAPTAAPRTLRCSLTWTRMVLTSAQVRAKSKFWYFIRQFKRIKRANGEVMACNEVRLCRVD
jgi:hypothetical protein